MKVVDQAEAEFLQLEFVLTQGLRGGLLWAEILNGLRWEVGGRKSEVGG